MSGYQADRTWQSDLIARYPHLFKITTHGKTYTPGYRIISCRRYDHDSDTFIDVDPKSPGIKEER